MEKETWRGETRLFRFTSLCGLFFLAAIGPVRAQLGTATISGNITDSSGAVIVGATVRAINNGTGFVRQTSSNQLGQYNLPGLTPGPYNVQVEFAGFRRAERSDITL